MKKKTIRIKESHLRKLIGDSIKYTLNESIDEGWLKNLGIGAGIAATLAGTPSCTKDNSFYRGDPTEQNYSGFTTEIEQAYKSMSDDSKFKNYAANELQPGETMIYEKIDHSNTSYYATSCQGQYIFIGLLKKNDGSLCGNTIRCHHEEVFNSYDKYDVISEQEIKNADSKSGEWEITFDNNDENGNCSVSSYTKFFEEWCNKDGGWENGMERVYDAWIKNNGYFVQTIKCEDIESHKYHVVNHQVSDKQTLMKYYNTQQHYGGNKGMIFDINDAISTQVVK